MNRPWDAELLGRIIRRAKELGICGEQADDELAVERVISALERLMLTTAIGPVEGSLDARSAQAMREAAAMLCRADIQDLMAQFPEVESPPRAASDIVQQEHTHITWNDKGQRMVNGELAPEHTIVQQYLKDGETPAECIARNRADVDTALGLLAAEKEKYQLLHDQWQAALKLVHERERQLREPENVAMKALWPLVHAVERAAWARNWTAATAARKALEPFLGPRPHFEPFEAPQKVCSCGVDLRPGMIDLGCPIHGEPEAHR